MSDVQAYTGNSESTVARQAALAIVDQVLTRRLALDQVLDDMRDLSSLPIRDRAFARMIAATTLRRLGQIDDIISRATDRGEAPSPPMLRNLLRTGVTQILFMDVPDYAAVDMSVRVAETVSLSRQTGFVNAVLRRVTREGRDWLTRQDEGRLNTPEWLMKIWIEDYGLRAAADIAQANLSEAPLDISVKDRNTLHYWSGTLQASVLATGTVRRASGGMVRDLPGFDDGMWWVQDAAAALPVQLLGNVSGKIVADLCAAPGGKTAQLAAAGASVIALDRSTKRLRRLQENMARLRLDQRVQTIASDAAEWRPKAPLNHILLDAPCTATGTIRRNPDVLHLKTVKDMDGLVATQARLLRAAADMLAVGGTLVYCTCSLQKAEGEAQVESFLRETTDIVRIPIRADEIGGLHSLITPDGDLRILPYHMAAHGGMDGFFISRLRRLA